MTIVVGIDGSPRSDDAQVLARLLADAADEQVVVAHAHPYGHLDSQLDVSERVRLIRAACEQVLTHARDGAEVELIEDKSPARALQELATRTDARAIVVGSSHRGPLGRVLPGSVVERLLSGAPCPVAIAPAGYAEREHVALKEIGCAFDGSPEAREAWKVSAGLAAQTRAHLRAIGVHERLTFGHIPVSASAAWTSVNQELRRQLDQDLQELVGATDHPETDSTLLDGTAADALADASRELDLLVVGSRGYGPAKAVLLGSVSASLARTAMCPLLVTPRGDA